MFYRILVRHYLPMAVKKDYNKMALERHKKMKGKLEVISKGKLITKDDWSTMYTPGVGAVHRSPHRDHRERPARDAWSKRA